MEEEVINLATYQFDTSRLEQSLERLQTQLFNIQQEQKRYAQSMTDLNKEQKTLVAEQELLIRSNQRGSQAFQENKKRLDEIKNSQLQVFQSQKDLAIQQSTVNKEYQQTVRTYQQYNTAEGQVISLQEQATQALNANITSVNAAREANKQLLAIRSQMNTDIPEEAALLKQLNAQYDSNIKYIKANVSEYENQKLAIGDYKNQIVEAAQELNIFNGGLIGFIGRAEKAGGVMPLLQEGLKGVSTAIVGATKASIAFIATPLGASIAVLAGIAAITKQWYDYNREIVKANRETAAITKLTGDALNQVRVQASVLAKTFDTDINETLMSARALANSFGISYTEALAKIEEGLIKAGPSSKEYLNTIKEYPTFFSQAGYSIEEFNSIVNTGIDLGIYNDKLPDALKEFALSVNEQTTATRDAMINAFGEEFTNGLFNNINNGSITVKDALSQISSEAERIGLNAKQAQTLTADLFRGAGEDAGGALKIFEAVNKSIADQNRELTEVEQSVKDLTDSEMALAEAQDAAFNSPGFEKWRNKAIMLLNDVAAAWYDTIAVITNSTEELEMAALESSARETIKQNAEQGLKEFEAYTEALEKRMGDRFNLDQATKSYIENLNTSLERALQEKDDLEVRSIKAEISAIEEGQIEKNEILNRYGIEEAEARQKRFEDYIERLNLELQLFEQAQGEKAKGYSEEIEAAQRVHDYKIEIAQAEYRASEKTENDKLKLQLATNQASIDLANEKVTAMSASLDEEVQLYLNANQTILKDNIRLNADIVANEQQRLDDLFTLNLNALNYRLENELLTQIEYDAAFLELYEETETKKRDLSLKYDQQTRDDIAERDKLEHEAELLNLETTGWESFERRQLINDEQYAVESAKLQKRLDDGLITQENYEIALNNLKKEHAQVDKQIEEDKNKYKIDLARDAYGNLATIMGKQTAAGKAFAIAQATIDTYQSAVSSFKALSGIPIVGPALAAVAAGAAIATGIANVKKIASTKEPQGYARGVIGLQGEGTGTSDSIPVNLSNGESVITAQSTRLFPNTLSAINQLGGGIGAESNSVVQNGIMQDALGINMTEAIANAVMAGAEAGTRNGAQMGIVELSDNREVARNAKF